MNFMRLPEQNGGIEGDKLSGLNRNRMVKEKRKKF
jgi:hypothetical protein